MDSEHSSDAFGTSEPSTKSPTQKYVLPGHQDDLKPESSILNQDGAGSGPTSKSPVQGYVLPNHEGGSKLESDDADQEDTDSDSNTESAAQEHFSPRGQEGQEFSVTVAEHRVVDYDNRRAAVPFPRIPAHRPMNTVTDESLYKLLSEGFGKDSSEYCAAAGIPDRQQALPPISYGSSEHHWQETNMAQASNPLARDSLASNGHGRTKAGAEVRYLGNFTDESVYDPRSAGFGKDSSEYCVAAGIPDRQQALPPISYGSSEHHWQETNMAQASNPPARDSLALNSRTRAGAGARFPGNHSGAAEQKLHQDPRNNAPSPTFNTASPGENVLPPMRTNPSPLRERTGPHRSHDNKSFRRNNNDDNNSSSSLPLNTQIDKSTPADQWPSRQLPPPRCLYPSECESRSVIWAPKDGQPFHFVQGSTQPPGPPMKPFDGKKAEDIAQELRRISRLKSERRERETRLVTAHEGSGSVG